MLPREPLCAGWAIRLRRPARRRSSPSRQSFRRAILTSAELADQLGISEDWILTRTGIRERRRASADERLTDYATRAAAAALDAAEVGCTAISIW